MSSSHAQYLNFLGGRFVIMKSLGGSFVISIRLGGRFVICRYKNYQCVYRVCIT